MSIFDMHDHHVITFDEYKKRYVINLLSVVESTVKLLDIDK